MLQRVTSANVHLRIAWNAASIPSDGYGCWRWPVQQNECHDNVAFAATCSRAEWRVDVQTKTRTRSRVRGDVNRWYSKVMRVTTTHGGKVAATQPPQLFNDEFGARHNPSSRRVELGPPQACVAVPRLVLLDNFQERRSCCAQHDVAACDAVPNTVPAGRSRQTERRGMGTERDATKLRMNEKRPPGQHQPRTKHAKTPRADSQPPTIHPSACTYTRTCE